MSFSLSENGEPLHGQCRTLVVPKQRSQTCQLVLKALPSLAYYVRDLLNHSLLPTVHLCCIIYNPSANCNGEKLLELEP